LSSFIAFSLLIGISASDLWTRAKPQPVIVKSEEAALGVEELEKLLGASTPEQVAHGKELFGVNCAVCHGAEGKGDGAAGAALNPKPRNFHAGMGEWVNGASSKSIYVTLMYGVPGSGMASYKALPTKDRIALIHFLHTWTPEQVGKADERFAAAVKEDGIGEGAGSGPAAKLPVDFAIDRVIQN
jgi:mono/diheme cytochrome c family protein